MWLRTAAGARVQVTAIKKWTAYQRVHNLTIADIHTYYVLAGTTPVLVHNTNPNCPVTFADMGNGDSVSPGGLVYGPGKIDHVLAHSVPNQSRATHTVFIEKSQNKVLDLVDQAWTKRSQAVRDPDDEFQFTIPMGRKIGTNGEDHMRIAVDPATNRILSAYPISKP